VALGALLICGQVVCAQENAVQAQLRQASEAVSRNPSSAEAQARLGMAYQNAGDHPKAVQSFERALELDSRLPRVGILLAFSYLPLGKYREAVPFLERALDTESDTGIRVAAGEKLVECYFALGDEERGLMAVQKLRAAAPDDPDVLYMASKVYANLWNTSVQRMLEKTPDSYRVHQVLAEVFETQEKYGEAAREYREILRKAPQAPGAHYRLGRMLARSNEDAAALAEFEAELSQNAGDVPTLVEAGELKLKAGKPGEALGLFTRALDVNPSYPAARLGLAKTLIAQKQFEKAIEQLAEARKLSPAEESIAYNLMIAFRSLGRADEAKQAMAEFQRLKKEKDDRLALTRSRLKGVPLQ
jgi:tetratricopeptide (TPR) repeat protein